MSESQPNAHHPLSLLLEASARLNTLRAAAVSFAPDPSAPDVPRSVDEADDLADAGRLLALRLTAHTPTAHELRYLIEGYGLAACGGTPEPDRGLNPGTALPPFASAEGELRSWMLASFAQFVLVTAGEERLVRLLLETPAGQVEESARRLLGAPLHELEERWRTTVRRPGGTGLAGARARRGLLGLAGRRLRPYWRRQLEIVGYMLLGLVFTASFPFAYRILIDEAIPGRDTGAVVTILALLLATVVVSSFADLRRTHLACWVSSAVVRDIRVEMYERLQRHSPRWHSRRDGGDLLTRVFTDVAVLEQGLSLALRDGAFQALTLVVAGTVLVILHPVLGAVVLLGAPVVALLYRVLAPGVHRRSVLVQEQLSSLMSLASENHGMQTVVSAFGLERREVGRFRIGSAGLIRRDVRLQLFSAVFGVSVNVVVTVLRVVVIALGAVMIFRGELTIGGLVAFVALMGSALTPVAFLTQVGQHLQTAAASRSRIDEVLDAVPDVREAPNAHPVSPPLGRLRLVDVHFSYDENRPALRGIDLEIAPGEHVAVVGASGSGKSTLLHLLLRLQDPTWGRIEVDGRDLREVSLPSLRAQVGYVPQETVLFNASIRENIAVGRADASAARVELAAVAAGLGGVLAALPDGLDTVVGERGARLSGGQRQRVALARALVRDPSLLLLDEPASALDAHGEAALSETLRAASGATVVVVTHRLHSMHAYDRIVVLLDGRVREVGTHQALLRAGGQYAGLWREQHEPSTHGDRAMARHVGAPEPRLAACSTCRGRSS